MSSAQGKLSPEARAAFRAELLGRIPSWYRPTLHLVCPSLVGLGVMIALGCQIRDLRALDLLAIPTMLILSNAAEWRAHRDLLHRRMPFAKVLYDRHTPMHHRLFVSEDMAISSPLEFRLVLIPAFGLLAIVAGTLALALGVMDLGYRNVGALLGMAGMLYGISYEWLHLAYHLPPSSFVGRLRMIQWLRRHHATHHAPELMQRWNFNVTLPLWDWVRGTLYRGAPPA